MSTPSKPTWPADWHDLSAEDKVWLEGVAAALTSGDMDAAYAEITGAEQDIQGRTTVSTAGPDAPAQVTLPIVPKTK